MPQRSGDDPEQPLLHAVTVVPPSPLRITAHSGVAPEHALPQRPQFAFVARSDSQPFANMPSQLSYPGSQATTAHAAAMHVVSARGATQTVPHPPQFSGSRETSMHRVPQHISVGPQGAHGELSIGTTSLVASVPPVSPSPDTASNASLASSASNPTSNASGIASALGSSSVASPDSSATRSRAVLSATVESPRESRPGLTPSIRVRGSSDAQFGQPASTATHATTAQRSARRRVRATPTPTPPASCSLRSRLIAGGGRIERSSRAVRSTVRTPRRRRRRAGGQRA